MDMEQEQYSGKQATLSLPARRKASIPWDSDDHTWTAADEAYFSSLLHGSPAPSPCRSLSPPAGGDLNTPPRTTLSTRSALPPVLAAESSATAPTTVSCITEREVITPPDPENQPKPSHNWLRNYRIPKRRRPSPPPPPPASINPEPAQTRPRHADARSQIQVRCVTVPTPVTEGTDRPTGPVANTVFTLRQQADLLESSAQALRRQAQALTHRPLEYRPPRGEC